MTAEAPAQWLPVSGDRLTMAGPDGGGLTAWRVESCALVGPDRYAVIISPAGEPETEGP